MIIVFTLSIVVFIVALGAAIEASYNSKKSKQRYDKKIPPSCI